MEKHMALNDWFSQLFADPKQSGGNIPLGANTGARQNLGVNGLLTETPGVALVSSPYPVVPSILNSGLLSPSLGDNDRGGPSDGTSQLSSNMGAKGAFGETRGLYPQPSFPSSIYNMDGWDPASATNLNMARTWIAEVQKRNHTMKYVDKPSGSNTIENNQWQLAATAAKNASNLSPADVRNFFIRQDGVGPQAPGWSGGSKPYKSFGPFLNTGGGDVPRGKNTYIDFYKGVK
jgi:hypothetical protein